MEWSAKEFQEYAKTGKIPERYQKEEADKKKAKNKFGARKVNNDYGSFDSIGEYKRYLDLILKQKAGLITELKHHTIFILLKKTKEYRAIKYESDFDYKNEFGEYIVEDYKVRATITQSFKDKCKMMLSVHNIKVRIFVYGEGFIN